MSDEVCVQWLFGVSNGMFPREAHSLTQGAETDTSAYVLPLPCHSLFFASLINNLQPWRKRLQQAGERQLAQGRHRALEAISSLIGQQLKLGALSIQSWFPCPSVLSVHHRPHQTVNPLLVPDIELPHLLWSLFLLAKAAMLSPCAIRWPAWLLPNYFSSATCPNIISPPCSVCLK